ncbi:hypothetical protein NL344_27030, partial [Klebsiella pneumoniae]|nr:hypothetical protein [Klebsiella pneumoniae]
NHAAFKPWKYSHYFEFDFVKSDKNISARCAWEENFFLQRKNPKLPSKRRVRYDCNGKFTEKLADSSTDRCGTPAPG